MPLGLCKETVSGLLKTPEIPTSHMIPLFIVTRAIPTYIQTNQSQKGDAGLFEEMSHTPLTVPLPPGRDCVAVYISLHTTWMECTKEHYSFQHFTQVWFILHWQQYHNYSQGYDSKLTHSCLDCSFIRKLDLNLNKAIYFYTMYSAMTTCDYMVFFRWLILI